MGLFEDLAKRADCLISDLRGTANAQWMPSLLDEFAQKSYALSEWQELSAYLVGESAAFSDAAEAVRFIKARL